jgi:hypothetical protein
MSGGSNDVLVIAKRLSREATVCSQYSIVGTYADDSSTFVKHASLLKNSASVVAGTSVGVWHTGPPIVSGPITQSAFGEATSEAHVVGEFRLRPSQCDAIANFLAGIDKYHRTMTVQPLQQYVILPHHKWVVSKETNRRIRRKFSCAGFVIEAYAAAGILLIDVDQLPLAGVDHVEFAYPEFRRLEELSEAVKQRIEFPGLEEFGIVGDGPWPIALPGYLFHACDRGQTIEEFTTFVVSTVNMLFFPKA